MSDKNVHSEVTSVSTPPENISVPNKQLAEFEDSMARLMLVHGSSSKRSRVFSVNLKTNAYRCFKCGSAVSVITNRGVGPSLFLVMTFADAVALTAVYLHGRDPADRE
jgi:hypothetical protein